MMCANSHAPPHSRVRAPYILAALFAVDAILLACEWLRWPPFVGQKGWPVLIAASVTGAAILLIAVFLAVAICFRWHFQFGLTSLLFLVLAVSVPCSWFATEVRAALRQQQVRHLATMNVDYDLMLIYSTGEMPFKDDGNGELNGYWKPQAAIRAPNWLLRLLGIDFFADVVSIHAEYDIDAASLKELSALPRLQTLRMGDSHTTGAGLENLAALPNLRKLDLSESRIDDAGLKHLEGVTQLESLDLSETSVGDEGLQHLRRLTRLRALKLDNTKVGDRGLSNLQGLTELRELSLGRSYVTGNGLRYLKGLRNLRILNLHLTQVTSDGLESLEGLSELAELDLRSTSVGDAGLEHLKALSKLRKLYLFWDNIDDLETVEKLRKALPNCEISIH